MKRICLTILSIALGVFAAQAQDSESMVDSLALNAQNVAKDAYVEFPYSKVMFATKQELNAQKFKYDSYYNQMKLQHVNGLLAVLNVFSDVYLPGTNDYRITIQYGEGDMISNIQVTFYDKDIYEHILLFASDKGCDVQKITNGKGKTFSFVYGGYTFNLEYTTVTQQVSNTSTSNSKDGSHAHSTTSTHEVTYDQYVYTIYTGYEPKSEYLDKMAQRKAKRAMKGRKSNSSADFL